jgi:hypothetical protein
LAIALAGCLGTISERMIEEVEVLTAEHRSRLSSQSAE